MTLTIRPRRLRTSPRLRRMVRENRLEPGQLIYPMFVRKGRGVREEIPSMPGQFRYSVDLLVPELERVQELEIAGVMLFGIPDPSEKDALGTPGYREDGLICRALREAREKVADLLLIADVCLCEYTDHGHCGRLLDNPPRVDNDGTLELLSKEALAYARAGAHVVAPSDMMDGRVGAIRRTLDTEGFQETAILSYAAKYASAYYGPFREAAESAPSFGDRKSYQMDPANAREAEREVRLDLEEGADMVMVKPALPYLDIIHRVRRMSGVPVAAYQVSGEYSALCAAFAQGWLNRDQTVRETLLSIRRAGADILLTYFACEVAERIRRGDWNE